MRRLYYMHPINTYDTELERQQLELISRIFLDWEVVNPNAPEHQEGYKLNGISYFTDLAASCQGGVALPFRDGKIGSGIFKEAFSLTQNNCPVWKLTFTGRLSTLDVKDETLRLSIEETRARIRKEDGSRKDY